MFCIKKLQAKNSIMKTGNNPSLVEDLARSWVWKKCGSSDIQENMDWWLCFESEHAERKKTTESEREKKYCRQRKQLTVS